MPVRSVESLAEPELEAYRQLGNPRWHRSHGLFVAEGRWVVERLIGGGRHRLRSVLLNPAATRALDASLSRLDPGVPVYVAPAAVIERLTGRDFHRGCLAIAERPRPRSMGELLPLTSRWLVIDGVVDPDNVGSLFRSALAFGIDAVALGAGSADPLYRKAIRTSMAAALEVPFAEVAGEGWSQVMRALSAEGVATLALTPRAPSVDLDAFVRRGPLPARFALIVGAEGSGLCGDLEQGADVRLRIPIRPSVDSLNVGVAGAIALSRLCPVSVR